MRKAALSHVGEYEDVVYTDSDGVYGVTRV